MWKIRERNSSSKASYLFGTIHVPYTRVWDSIPDMTKTAFRQSDHIIFELDLLNPVTVGALSKCQLLPGGRKLNQVIPRDLFKRIKKHLKYVKLKIGGWMNVDQRRRGLYTEYLFNAITTNWQRKRPIWVMLMINSLTESDIRSRGVPVLDIYLAQEAQRMNKRIGAVERVKDQCLPLNSLNTTLAIYLLNKTLGQHENTRRGRIISTSPFSTTDDLIDRYNCGYLETQVSNAFIPFITIHSIHNLSTDPSFRQEINALLKMAASDISSSSTSSDDETKMSQVIENYFKTEFMMKRNEKMSQTLKSFLKNNPQKSYFIAFGVGHFLGNNSVIDLLTQDGFDVHRMNKPFDDGG